MSDYKDNYLNLITSQHRDRPKYIKMVSGVLDIVQDVSGASYSLSQCFDLDGASGAQLDEIGKRVGADRVVPVDDEFAYTLTDDDFRIYIKSKIVKNMWDGGIESLQDDWHELFGNYVIIVDNQDMTIDVYVMGVFSQAVIDLIKAHKIVPKPISVGVRVYYFAPGRLFSYGLDNALCTGYGGWWRHIGTEPVFAYDTPKEEGGLAGYNVGYWNNSV